MAQEILESEVYRELESIQNQSLVYPDCKFLTFFFLPFVLPFYSLLSFLLRVVVNDGVTA